MSFSVARTVIVVSFLALVAVVVLVAGGSGFEQVTEAAAADTGLIWG